jgi:protein TonB
MGGGLAGSGMKPTAPAAPLPVGGDVKQARLISSTPPLYPALAKAQHVEGAVHLDALVDEHGRVSSVKVINGPTLLHQAATDAIRQWKYQPATLDGKPVPMHLTVTLQFKLQ